MRVLRTLVSTALVVPVVMATTVTSSWAVSPAPGPAAPAPVSASPAEPVTPQVEEVPGEVVAERAATAAELAPAAPAAVADATTHLVAAERPETFAVLGVVWDGQAEPGTALRARWATADGTWSEWAPMTTLELASPSGRGGTEPLWTDTATRAEVEVSTPGATLPTGLSVALVDPGTSAADATPVPLSATAAGAATGADAPRFAGASPLSTQSSTGTRATAVPAPAVYPRSAWGADESLRSSNPTYQSQVKALVVHHTASSSTYDCADVPAVLRGLYAYDVRTLGWGDIAYNFIVDRCGKTWEAAAGGVASSVRSVHAGGFNSGTQGVALLGNYDTTQPSTAMMDSLTRLLAWKSGLFGIDPGGTTRLTQAGGNGTTAKYTDGQTVTLPTIFGHRTVGSTACPGRYVVPLLDGVIARADAAVADATTARYFLTNGRPGPVTALPFGDPGDVPLLCDWNADGFDTPGVFRRGVWYLRDANTAGGATTVFALGNATDQPVCGDWDGDGRDTPGVVRGAVFHLKNTVSGGVADGSFTFGRAGDTAVVGDWNGDGFDTPGVVRAVGPALVFELTNSNLAPQVHGVVSFGNATDQPVSGDWNGDGFTTVGVYREGTVFLTDSNLDPTASSRYGFGDAGDTALGGELDGDGRVSVSLARAYS